MSRVITEPLHATFTETTPSRAFNTTFTPSTGRPTLVIYSVSISVGQAVDGQVNLVSDSNATPTTIRGIVRNEVQAAGLLGATASSIVDGILVYLVPANHNVRLNTVNNAGTATFTLASQTEITL